MSRFVTHEELATALRGTCTGIGKLIREEIGGRAPASQAAKHQTLRMQFAQVQKFVAAGTRKIRGIASSDSLDLAGDIVMPTGGKWSLPLPLLWAHDHLQPIGRVVEAEVRGSAIHVVAEVASGVPKADEVWELLERQLAASFSIGFIGERGEPIATGTRWTKWTWVELSVVTVPANQDARITATRAARSGDGSVKLINHTGAVRLVRSG